MDFVQVLANALSGDQNARSLALHQLTEMANQNLGIFMSMLATYLTRSDLPMEVRQVAALTAKNQLSSNDADELDAKFNRWRALDDQTKNAIHALALQGLTANDARVGTAAAQLVSSIAAVDLPDNKWPDLIHQLLHNVQNSTVPLLTRSSIEALGFICEEAGETASEVLNAQSGEILHAVVLGCGDNQPDDIKIASIRSLLSSLEFVRRNFERESDRDYIMQVVCTATLKPNLQVKVVAFQCLVNIMSLYYDYMQPYMETALFGLTVNAMLNEPEDVVLQAIEFWSTVCDVEMEIDFYNADAQEAGGNNLRTNRNFARTALPHVVPQMLRLLRKENEEIDDQEWNVAKASSTCLYLLAKCVGKDIIPLVLPFVEQHVRNPEWQLREAALMAFGSILEGPDADILAPLAKQALPLLVTSMSDSNVAVQDTAAWTVGVICDFLSMAVDDSNLIPLLEALTAGLKSHPRVAASCAWAISNLAENLNASEPQPTYPLSPVFLQLMTNLLNAVSRNDASEGNLRITAYTALTSLVEGAAEDVYSVLLQLAQLLVEKMGNGFNKQFVNADDRREFLEEQANICATLTSTIRKLEHQISPLADIIMQLFLKVFTSPLTGQNPEIIEDSIIAIGALADALGREFSRYVEHFNPFLFTYITNVQEHTVCLHAVGLVGDICRALNGDVAPFVDGYMQCLLNCAQNDQVHRDVKPHILSTFGDVAQAIGDRFTPYLQNVMNVLRGASVVDIQQVDAISIEYMSSLRISVVEGFTGIIQVYNGPEKSQAIRPFADAIIQFAERIYKDPNRTEELTKATVGMIGDLADSCGRNIGGSLSHNMGWLQPLIQECSQSRITSTRETSTWTMQRVRAATS